MRTIEQLVAERERIDKQIAKSKADGIIAIRKQMEALGITAEDLAGRPLRPGAKAARPVKYADDKGNTWTGVGQRPRWLRAALLAGASLEQFRVRG